MPPKRNHAASNSSSRRNRNHQSDDNDGEDHHNDYYSDEQQQIQANFAPPPINRFSHAVQQQASSQPNNNNNGNFGGTSAAQSLHSNPQWCAFKIGDKSESDVERVMIAYLEKYHLQDIRDILCPPLTLTNDDTIHYSVFIDVLHFMSANIEIGSLLISYPFELIPIFERALIKAQQRYIEKQEVMKDQFKLKLLVHARLHTLPQCSEVTKTSVSSVRSCDANRLISVSGTVIKTGPIKMLEFKKVYVCRKCKKPFEIVADREQYNTIVKPTQCPVEDCGGKSFISRDEEIVCRDYQEIKIQDKISQLHVGSIPRSILVVLEDDLVDVVKAGDDIIITGVPYRRWKTLKNDVRCSIDMAIWCNHIRISNEKKSSAMNVTEEIKSEFKHFWQEYHQQPLTGRNLILKSMCPQLYGLYFVKLAVALTIIGGVPMKKNNTRIRGESHLLIVGDPGTGKSQFLKYASKLSPRYVMTNGIGTTSAGLTVMATKESGGDWTLEAGALVLADGGVCCIDEFDSIRDHDRATIHEAMEQQTLSIAKAGLVCKLNTRTTVLAACNPKGKYDLGASLSVNCALASPLLSRFDIVLVLLDTQDEEWDHRVSSFILNEQEMEEEDSQLWSFDKLRAYISYVKSEFHPQLTPESGRILTEYYRLQRRADRRVAARTTIRLLESLVRLAQAHARLMCRHEVTVQDAIMSVLTVDISSNTSSLLNVESVLHSNFPLNPDSDYSNYIPLVLYKLGIVSQVQSAAVSLRPSMIMGGDLNFAIQKTSHDENDNNDNDDHNTISRPGRTTSSSSSSSEKNSLKKQTKDAVAATVTRELLIDDDDDEESNVFDFQEDDTHHEDQHSVRRTPLRHATISTTHKRTLNSMNDDTEGYDDEKYSMNEESVEDEQHVQPQLKKKKQLISSEELDHAERDIQKTPSLSNSVEIHFRQHFEQKQRVMRRLEFNKNDDTNSTIAMDTSNDFEVRHGGGDGSGMERTHEDQHVNTTTCAIPQQVLPQHGTTLPPLQTQLRQTSNKTSLLQQPPQNATSNVPLTGIQAQRGSKSLLPITSKQNIVSSASTTDSNQNTAATSGTTTTTTTEISTIATSTTTIENTSAAPTKRRGFLSTLLSKGAPPTSNPTVSATKTAQLTSTVDNNSRHQQDQNIGETSFEFPSLLLGEMDEGLSLSTPEKPTKVASKRMIEDNDDELDNLI